jgi:hypothetical protein
MSKHGLLVWHGYVVILQIKEARKENKDCLSKEINNTNLVFLGMA